MKPSSPPPPTTTTTTFNTSCQLIRCGLFMWKFGCVFDLRLHDLNANKKRRWKTDFTHYYTFSRLSQVTQSLKRREIRLELKWGERVRGQTEIVNFIALPFHLLFCFLTLLLFWHSRFLRRSSFLDHFTFLGNCQPILPLSQHFALSKN